jgi:hypothetical protein
MLAAFGEREVAVRDDIRPPVLGRDVVARINRLTGAAEGLVDLGRSVVLQLAVLGGRLMVAVDVPWPAVAGAVVAGYVVLVQRALGAVHGWVVVVATRVGEV